jgi:parvulin-like peptidyl-prolyl isomerase
VVGAVNGWRTGPNDREGSEGRQRATGSGTSAGDEEEDEGMKLSRRTNTIILWIISIGLLVGMIITFTPTIGGFGGGADRGRPLVLVNGEPITDLEVARARQNPLFSSVREGQVGEDLDLLLVDQLVRQEVFDQAAAKTRVSGREVRQEVQDFREAQGVAGRRNDQAYLRLIGQSGFDDQSFREYLEEQLRRRKYEESLTANVEVEGAEVETFYLANASEYRQEDRVRARMIVVEDAGLAKELREQLEAGASFADLAREHSLERGDRAGALGAPQGSTEPRPVGRAALPQAVATAAFGLRGPGLTQVLQSGDRAYLVKVEEYIPEQAQPLSEVEEQVRADALEAKRAGVVRERIDRLVEQAKVEIQQGSDLEYDDYVVARVGDQEIRASDLAVATYTNQQIQQNLSPQLAPLIVEFFKPTILERLIDRKLAYLGAKNLDAEFVGTEGQVAEQALAFVSRDAEVDEAEVAEYYAANQRRFTVPAEADVTRVTFDSQEAAESFRSLVLSGVQPAAAAEETSGSLDDLGVVREGQIAEALDRALFGTEAFEPLPEGEREVSDVLVVQGEATEEGAEPAQEGALEGDGSEGESDAGAEADRRSEESFVVLVAARTPESVRALEEVRGQVEEAVLQAERAELSQQWLDRLREEIEVVNLLAQAREEEGSAEGGSAGAADGQEAAGGEAEADAEGNEEAGGGAAGGESEAE